MDYECSYVWCLTKHILSFVLLIQFFPVFLRCSSDPRLKPWVVSHRFINHIVKTAIREIPIFGFNTSKVFRNLGGVYLKKSTFSIQNFPDSYRDQNSKFFPLAFLHPPPIPNKLLKFEILIINCNSNVKIKLLSDSLKLIYRIIQIKNCDYTKI